MIYFLLIKQYYRIHTDKSRNFKRETLIHTPNQEKKRQQSNGQFHMSQKISKALRKNISTKQYLIPLVFKMTQQAVITATEVH